MATSLVLEWEPKYEDPEDPWPFTHATFVFATREAIVRFETHTYCNDVTLEIRHPDFQFEFSALAIRDILYSEEDGIETLELKLTEYISTFLTLRPVITIRQERRGSRESQYDD